MPLDDIKISRVIIEDFLKTFIDYCEVDAAIVGAGPAGLIASKRLAEAGAKVAVFERKLSIGGGMWGGGMMFPRIVLQREALSLLGEFDITYWEGGERGYYVANSIEAVTKLAARAVSVGAQIFNLMSVEDVLIKAGERVEGLVINWTAVEAAALHVDPLTIKAKLVIDCTGHPAEVCRIVERKVPEAELKVFGERSMWAERGEKILLETTKEVYPGLLVAGMAANAVAGGPRMGPIFGGMLLSGARAAEVALTKI